MKHPEPRTSEHDGQSPLDSFATEMPIVEISSASDAPSPLSSFPEEGLSSPLDCFASEPSTVEGLFESDSSRIALPKLPENSPLDWFLAEPSAVETPSASDAPKGALSEFIQEEVRSIPAAAAKNRAAGWKSPTYALAAAVVVGAIGGALWARFVPETRRVGIEISTQAPALAPVGDPRTSAPSRPPIELLSSIQVRPSARPPIARVVANAPAIASEPPPGPGEAQRRGSRQAVDIAARESRQPKGTSVPRGTSTGAVPVQTPTAVRATPSAPAPTAPVAANSPEPSPVSEPPPATAPPAVAANIAPPRAPAPAAGPAPEALPSAVGRTEESEIQRALGLYRTAYQRLDAEAARTVWPSVDVRALARAFDTLNSQELVFEACVFEITGEVATARCRGTATYTPKVGSRKPRLEPRQWTFHLRKMSQSWKIQSAQAKG